MLAFTRYPELDFTWFVLKSDTSADEWHVGRICKSRIDEI